MISFDRSSPILAPSKPLKERRILVVRRDNIGDLICTLPLFGALRHHFPNAHLGALVNSYNAPLLTDNAYLNQIHIYTKGKHQPQTSVYRQGWDRLTLLRHIRQQHYDLAILAGTGVRRETRLFLRAAGITQHILDHAGGAATHHEVERLYALLAPLGIQGHPAQPCLTPDPARVRALQVQWAAAGINHPFAIHISAREEHNRWPLSHFIDLIQQGTARGLRFIVLWAPGDPTKPEHPGDDLRAQTLLNHCQGLPVLGVPTPDLSALAVALAAARTMIGADGGHCHIAAAVNTPVIGLYCAHKVTQWRPYGSGHVILEGKVVADISVQAVLKALASSS